MRKFLLPAVTATCLAVDWQVWNLGVPGYNTSQELTTLRRFGPLYQPDLVVVGFYDNDILDNPEPPPITRRRLW